LQGATGLNNLAQGTIQTSNGIAAFIPGVNSAVQAGTSISQIPGALNGEVDGGQVITNALGFNPVTNAVAGATDIVLGTGAMLLGVVQILLAAGRLGR
jgi:hypothetical protein